MKATRLESSVLQVLEMRGVSKRYPGTLAINAVDFDIRAGEVHALMGENGAGKSTLMRMLAGSFDDYSGQILIQGREVDLRSPAAARQHGIGMVYQELSLARPISIAENLLVGRLPVKCGIFLSRKALLKESRKCLLRVGLDLDPSLTIEEISQHEAQLVEIAKVLGNQPKILVLDEPTSALSREEIGRLFRLIEDLKRQGLAIVYISHHLSEVFQVADRVTVLRDGKKVATEPLAKVNAQALVRMMVGQTIDEFYSQRDTQIGETVLRLSNLTREGFFQNVSFELRRGEILGVIGLTGSGRTEMARSLCGLDPVHTGWVELRGERLRRGKYARAVAEGLVYLSENRKDEGLFLRLSVRRNLLAALVSRRAKTRASRSRDDALASREVMDSLQIAAASPDTDAGNLSGGNQQKVLLGKWVLTCPEVLILDEPSRGVDVNAKRKIHATVMDLADRGTAVLLISSDLTELVGLSDRAIVLREGHLIGELSKDQLSEESALLAANGQGLPQPREES